MPSQLHAFVLSQNLKEAADKVLSGDYIYSEVVERLKQFLSKAQNLKLAELEADVLLMFGILNMSEGILDEALRYLRQGYERSLELSYAKGIGRGLNNISVILERQGKMEEALKISEEAVTICQRYAELRPFMILLSLNLACAYDGFSRLEEAEQQYQAALNYYQQLNAQERKEPVCAKNIGNVYYGLADLQRKRKNYAQARQNALLSVEISAKGAFTNAQIVAQAILFRIIYEDPSTDWERDIGWANLKAEIQEVIQTNAGIGDVAFALLLEGEYWLERHEPRYTHYFAEMTQTYYGDKLDETLRQRLVALLNASVKV